MSFDPGKRKQKLLIVKTIGITMAIGFMLLALYIKEIGPLIGLSPTFCSSQIIRYIFFAMGVMDLIMFTFVIK